MVAQGQASFSAATALNPATFMAMMPSPAVTVPGAASVPRAVEKQPAEAAKSRFWMPDLVAGPWHVFTPVGLSVVSTCGNLCGLVAAAAHDHITMRFFMVSAASGVAAFNFLMPKPLKAHQWTAGGWGSAFAVLHLVNLALLLHEHDHGVNLTEEEEAVYEHGFQRFGVTPRQFTNIMQAGAKYKNYAPGEVLTEAGTPVKEVFYVVGGTCEARHPQTNTLRIEYHDDVFVGCLEPREWHFDLQPKDWKASHPQQETEEELEENSTVKGRRTAKSRRDLRAMLVTGFEEKTGPRTRLVVGASWQNKNIAGPEGCRMICWPLAAFAAAVGKDEKLVLAMEKLDEMGLACKICAGASRKAIEGYREVLDSVLMEGRVKDDDKHALIRYRVRYAVPEAEHIRMLEELGWTKEEFDNGIKKDFRAWRAANH